jgi:hypothetical protein
MARAKAEVADFRYHSQYDMGDVAPWLIQATQAGY